MKHLFFLITIISVGILCAGMSVPGVGSVKKTRSPDVVRVIIARDEPEVRISWTRGCRVTMFQTDELLLERDGSGEVVIKATPNGLRWDDLVLGIESIVIAPKDARGPLRNNGAAYHGDLAIRMDTLTALSVTNILDIEDYIRGVLAKEVPHEWPMEALKAQAIVARTYALYVQRFALTQPFDLHADVMSQVYGGVQGERGRTNRAVEETRGQVLYFDEKVLPSFYHACCGGHTENAREIWGIDITPLQGRPCDHCAKAPHYAWERKLSLADITTRLKNAGIEIDPLTDIAVNEKNDSGRVTDISLITATETQHMTGREFRRALGGNLIKSIHMSITDDGKECIISGTGWGHGVGLCQWGAYGMAKQRHTAEEILEFYYPETEIVCIEDD